ncbi:hypothetical protein Taro_054882 [Colocasia esculenta]|uniref:Uncharacterized protein n=1 Tax=Colocasia esculenta TaxID=4460 RepID=A0A843XSK8_COLES|nr:hypothetical protein [Colocasia esculenta]
MSQVLRIHEPTLALTQTQEVFVCIELNIAKARHERIWIGCGQDGFWQKINYYRVSAVCGFCKKLGYAETECNKKSKDSIEATVPKAQQHDLITKQGGVAVTSQVWRQKVNPVDQAAPTQEEKESNPPEVMEAPVLPSQGLVHREEVGQGLHGAGPGGGQVLKGLKAIEGSLPSLHGLHGSPIVVPLHGSQSTQVPAAGDETGEVPLVMPPTGEEEQRQTGRSSAQSGEKKGGRSCNMEAMLDFNACINASSLQDDGYLGPKFTWSNKRTGHASILARLDRYLLNSYCEEKFPGLVGSKWQAKQSYRGGAAGAGMAVGDEALEEEEGRTGFRWFLDGPSSEYSEGAKNARRQAVKQALRAWNKSVFGDVETNVRTQEEEHINAGKSFFMVPAKMSPLAIQRIRDITGYKRQQGPLIYLGVPLRPGRVLVADYKYLMDKVHAKEVVNNASHPLRAVLPPGILQDIQLNDEEDRCIWAPSTSGTFTEKSFRAGDIINSIKLHISVALSNSSFISVPTLEDQQVLHIYGLNPHFSTKRIKLICWIPPEVSYCLNVDGASKGNPGNCGGGGGGCLRDSNGIVLAAFGHYYGSVDTNPRFQKTQLPDWDSVSTQPVAVSTLDPVPRRPVLQNWDSVSRHSMVVSTHSG